MLSASQRDLKLKNLLEKQKAEKQQFDEQYLNLVDMIKTKYNDDDFDPTKEKEVLKPFINHYTKQIEEKERQINSMQVIIEYLDNLLEHARNNETEVNEIKSQSSHILNIVNGLKNDLANLVVLVNKGN
tara:strand:+ start:881 stop:1267 length:387 start_codon:yes stop_codon:yes gene_type:complete